MHEPHDLLAYMGFTQAEIGVYLCLVDGVERVAEIMKRTQLKRPTVYYGIQRLLERGVIYKTGKSMGGRIGFKPEALLVYATERAKKVQEMHASTQEWVQGIMARTAGEHEKPLASFYEGIEAVKRVIIETFYTKSGHIDAIAPQKNFFHDMGKEFLESYVRERAMRKITMRSLWEEPAAPDIFQAYYAGLAEVRILPEVMKGMFETTLFLYDDTALTISSGKNAYALLMTSREHHRFMTALFEGLWSVSTAHPV